MKTLSDYIVIIENALPKELCEELIDTYESCHDYVIRKNETYSFSEINISEHTAFKKQEKVLSSITQKVHDSYVKYTKAEFLPLHHGYEQHRMKKYEPNGLDVFDWHTDVGDYASAKRYLVMFYYVNDVVEGGETVFNLGGNKYHSIKPKAGSIVCFPATFMYPHKGCKPISGPKYIISTYGHYL